MLGHTLGLSPFLSSYNYICSYLFCAFSLHTVINIFDREEKEAVIGVINVYGVRRYKGTEWVVEGKAKILFIIEDLR